MKISNKKAHFNYEIKDTFEAGVVLTGAEVKSIRDGRCNLSDSYVKIIDNQLWLVNADIARYKFDSNPDYDSARSRRLLVKRSEINRLSLELKKGNLTLIPVSIYTTRNLIKVEVGLGRGKRKFDKKNLEKDRDVKREMARVKRRYMV